MNIAVAMCYAGKNDEWLKQAIESNRSEKHNVVFFIHFDGCKMPANIQGGQDKIVSIESAERVGFANGINRCFMEIIKYHVKFDYIARMDDDDKCLAGRIDRQVMFMMDNPDCDFSGTLAAIINAQGNVVCSEWHYAEDNGKDMVQRFLDGGCHIVHASCMFKASMLYNKFHLWYNPLYIAIEDYDLWFRLLRLGYKYKLLPERLYLYREHSGQETKSPKAAQRNRLCENTHHFYKLNWSEFCI